MVDIVSSVEEDPIRQGVARNHGAIETESCERLPSNDSGDEETEPLIGTNRQPTTELNKRWTNVLFSICTTCYDTWYVLEDNVM